MADGYETFIDPVDSTVWEIDVAFLASTWVCIWDRGCRGIEDVAAPEHGLGCCSVGAELLDDDEAMRVAALAATLPPQRFQFHQDAVAGGVFSDDERRFTRTVRGACIFLNRPGFAGGVGCALHLGAVADGDSPLDWKPSVCWQLPLKVLRDSDGTSVTLRRWQRTDWGPGGASMAWCCTEEPDAYVGERRVIDTMGAELEALVGRDVAVAVRSRIGR